MRYLVMESQLGYAIVMDEQGRFKKVVNLDYEVGQTVDNILCFEENDEYQNKKRKRNIITLLATAACFCLLILGGYQQFMIPYGSVMMQINPEVQLQVNRFDRVIEIEALNDDGALLIDDYNGFGKKMETVSDELAGKAVELGFLEKGGEIYIQVDSQDQKWKQDVENKILIDLSESLENEIEIYLGTKELKESITIEIEETEETEVTEEPVSNQEVTNGGDNDDKLKNETAKEEITNEESNQTEEVQDTDYDTDDDNDDADDDEDDEDDVDDDDADDADDDDDASEEEND